MSYRLNAPRLRWGTALVNDVFLPYPLDNVLAGDATRDGCEFVQAPSGIEDAWITGEDYTLEADWRWLPAAATTSPLGTAWDGDTGVQAALRWARRKNLLRFYPDGRNVLNAPAMNSDGDADGVVDEWTLLHGAVTATASLDATDGAQKLVLSNTTGGALTVELLQWRTIPALTVLGASVDYKTLSLTAGSSIALRLMAYDATPTYVSDAAAVSTTAGSAGSYTRLATTSAGALASNATQVRVTMQITLAAGASGTVWFRNAVMQVNAVPATWIDAPYIDSYLVSPTSAEQQQAESDGTRSVKVKIRNATSAYTGY